MCAACFTLMGNTALVWMAKSTAASPIAYLAMSGYNAVTDTLDEVNCFSYHAATTGKGCIAKKDDPVYALSDLWIEAIEREIATFVEMDTWTLVPKAMATKAGKKVILTTWAFRMKRDAFNKPIKAKARLCGRGDLQSCFEAFESYSPVFQWSTVRLMLILSIVYGLHTWKVDYVNAFCQSTLDPD